VNKRNVLLKLLNVKNKPSANFWAREFSIFKRLLKKFPDENFWETVELKKVSSLLLYVNDCSGELEAVYNKFKTLSPHNVQKYQIGEKTGKKYKKTNKPKNTKQFLNTNEEKNNK
jgi:hypothetical protein